MVVNNYAVIKGRDIVNTIVADETFSLDGYILKPLEQGFGIGDYYEDESFVKRLMLNVEGELMPMNTVTIVPVLAKHDNVKLYIDGILYAEGETGDSWQVQFETIGKYLIKAVSDNYGTFEMEVEINE